MGVASVAGSLNTLATIGAGPWGAALTGGLINTAETMVGRTIDGKGMSIPDAYLAFGGGFAAGAIGGGLAKTSPVVHFGFNELLRQTMAEIAGDSTPDAAGCAEALGGR